MKPKSKFQEYIDDEHKRICKTARDPLTYSFGTPSTNDLGIPLDTKAKPVIPGNRPERHRMNAEGLIAYWMPLNTNTVIDVRPRHLSQIAMLQGALQIPLAEMEGRFEEIERHYKEAPRIICLCSRGNDSQLAAAWLRSKGLHAADVVGGMEEWKRTIDPTFPKLV